MESLLPAYEYGTVSILVAHNYNIYSSSEVDTLSLAYDYRSIMHYGKATFAKNTGDTVMITEEPKSARSTAKTHALHMQYSFQGTKCVGSTSWIDHM